MFELKIQLHKGGGSSTTVQSYKPTAEEKRLWRLEGDYQEMAMPYMQELLNISRSVINDNNYGTIGADFGALNNGALSQIDTAQRGVGDLAKGILPKEFNDNMALTLTNAANTAIGNRLNTLGQNGVLNSSVTNTALNDISKNVANTMADMYTTNIGTLNGLYGQMDSLAGDKITATAAAQEAALATPLSVLQASQGGSSNNISAIGALKGTGTTTSTQTTRGGNGLGGLFGSLIGAGATLGAAGINRGGRS